MESREAESAASRLPCLSSPPSSVEEISSQGRERQREKEIGLFPPRQPFLRSFVLTEGISWLAPGARFKLRFEEGGGRQAMIERVSVGRAAKRYFASRTFSESIHVRVHPAHCLPNAVLRTPICSSCLGFAAHASPSSVIERRQSVVDH